VAEDKNKAEQVDPARAAREAAKAVDPAPDAEAFPVARLIEEAPAFLDQPSYVAAGALSAVTKKNLTLDEAKAAIEEWLKTPLGQED
jgi:hypothetical protein